MFAPENLGVTMFISLPLAVVVLQFPFLLFVLLTAAFALRHERKIIEKYLSTERAGILSPKELQTLVPYYKKLGNHLSLVGTFKFKQYWRTRTRHKLLVNLAFERWHMDMEDDIGDEQSAHFHAIRVTELRRKLRALPLLA